MSPFTRGHLTPPMGSDALKYKPQNYTENHRIKYSPSLLVYQMADFLFKEITHKIIGAAFEVYKELGYGFLEKVYEKALLIELRSKGLKAENQKFIRILYKDESVGDYVADILVEDKRIVELKAEKEYNTKHEAQLINYLKATQLKVGLLINFGEKLCKPKRIVN